MGRVRHICTCILLVFSLQCIAAEDTTLQLQLVKNIPGNFTDFYADNLGNLYLIRSANQVKKISSDGDSLAVFNDVKRYGNIYSLDVTNPLKILVYYKDFATIIVLDRFLNIINTIDLRQSGILQVKAIAQSYDNNIWLYDELDGKLKKIDGSGNVLLESADFRLLFSDDFDPSRIIDNNGLLYLYDSKEGWIIFDYYGAFKRKIPFTAWKNVQVSDNRLTGTDSTGLVYYNPSQLELINAKTGINLPAAIKVVQQMHTLYVLTKSGIDIYTIQ